MFPARCNNTRVAIIFYFCLTIIACCAAMTATSSKNAIGSATRAGGAGGNDNGMAAQQRGVFYNRYRALLKRLLLSLDHRLAGLPNAVNSLRTSRGHNGLGTLSTKLLVKRLSSDHRLADLLASINNLGSSSGHHGIDLSANGKRKRSIGRNVVNRMSRRQQ